MFKKFAKKTLERFGIVAHKISSGTCVPEEKSYEIVATLVGRSDPVIIDGGAHRGDMPDRFGRLLPQSEFHCFEPDPTLSIYLEEKFSKNPKVHIVKKALGESTCQKKLNINASLATNSLLRTSEKLDDQLSKLTKTVSQIGVDVITIDDYCKLNKIKNLDIIKLDLQGYDYAALQGAKETLGKAKIILVEILFEKIYVGCHSFLDIMILMEKHEFELYTLCGLHYDKDLRLQWADAIFIRKNF